MNNAGTKPRRGPGLCEFLKDEKVTWPTDAAGFGPGAFRGRPELRAFIFGAPAVLQHAELLCADWAG